MYSMVTIIIILYGYLKVAKRVDLKSSHQKIKKIVTMCGDGC